MSKPTPIQQQLCNFLEYLEVEKQRSQKTLENYRHYLKRFFEWGRIETPQDITLQKVQKFRVWLHRQKGQQQETMKASTQNYHAISIRSFLKYLAKQDIQSLAPEKVELAKQEENDITILTPEELTRLLEAPKKDNSNSPHHTRRDLAVLHVLFSSGLRVAELVSLNRDDINLKTGEFRVKGKGGKIRLAFLSETAREYLQNYIDNRDDIDEALFIRHNISQSGKADDLRITPRTVQRIIKKYSVQAGIMKTVHPHMLRHQFATDLLTNGADLRSVQSMLGHASVTTTQRYTHITNKQLREIHQKFHNKKAEE